MKKSVEEYLEDRGCRVVRQSAEPAPCTFETLVDGFLVHVLRLDSESYRRAFWREAYRNGHTIGHVPRTFEAFFRRNARTFEEKVSLLMGVAALFGVYTVATLLYRRLSRLVKRLRRPTYYERERERRQKLALARREVRKHHTLNPQPTFDAIRAALHVARSSPEAAIRLGSLLEDLECFVDNTLIHDAQGQSPEAAIRLGSLLEDLECFVDNTLIHDAQGQIVGRRGGIKRLLQREAPDLFAKYSTIMRYKATAKRFRQACGSTEPVPPATLLPAPEAVGSESTPTSVPETTDSSSAPTSTLVGHSEPVPKATAFGTVPITASTPDGLSDEMRAQLAASCEVAKTILEECEGTLISLEAALALRLDPDCIPATGKEYIRKAGCPRIPRKVISWLVRHQVA